MLKTLRIRKKLRKLDPSAPNEGNGWFWWGSQHMCSQFSSRGPVGGGRRHRTGASETVRHLRHRVDYLVGRVFRGQKRGHDYFVHVRTVTHVCIVSVIDSTL